MKKVAITLHGTMTYKAHRTFEIEVPDEANIRLFDTKTVNDLVNDANVPWWFDEHGLLQANEHTIDDVTETDESLPANLPSTDPRMAFICSTFGIDPNHDPGLGD